MKQILPVSTEHLLPHHSFRPLLSSYFYTGRIIGPFLEKMYDPNAENFIFSFIKTRVRSGKPDFMALPTVQQNTHIHAKTYLDFSVFRCMKHESHFKIIMGFFKLQENVYRGAWMER
ncbi:hypothetical protein GDO81_006712 [Engystomops pustulosus]|uniref:Uncharacterized protein n=1 Tax=Engystomops pustulosus TaxID=76066 RepID=A0AAV7D0D3_ENGPU|nr:hypothetical protein GDO81_006712 [Engystomops pustulosus]